MSFTVISLCTLLSERMSAYACQHERAIGNRVTFSAHLWSAQSAFDFAVAWNEKPHYLIKDLDMNDLLKNARVDDIDLFGRVILIGMMGIDDVRGWFHTHGGIL
jgi:hypothetical protein